LTAGAHTAGQDPQVVQNVSIVSGGAYVARAAFEYASSTSPTFGVFFVAGTVNASAYASSLGMRQASVVSDGTSGAMVLVYDDAVVAGNSFDVGYVSYSRCALVSGGGQTGSVVLIDTIPSAADGLMPGDQVQIGDHLYLVTQRLGTDGRLQIVPPLRTSPADNAPVILHQPMARMMLADQTVGWSNVPGTRTSALSSITVEFVEDLL
jgi:hypothetical protein